MRIHFLSDDAFLVVVGASRRSMWYWIWDESKTDDYHSFRSTDFPWSLEFSPSLLLCISRIHISRSTFFFLRSSVGFILNPVGWCVMARMRILRKHCVMWFSLGLCDRSFPGPILSGDLWNAFPRKIVKMYLPPWMHCFQFQIQIEIVTDSVQSVPAVTHHVT